jgi:S-formylglutathione hydrolase
MLSIISESKCFDGIQRIYTHPSRATQCNMRFGIFIPPQAQYKKVPLLYWLSGLTCTEENFITKAGAQRIASELGMAIVVPDTSPRGAEVPDEVESYDFGIGAGFYVDATQSPWSQHYQMYTYIQTELFELIAAHFPVDEHRIGIFGHSMGGHGALLMALNNPHQYKSVSAFSPICSTMHCAWGEKSLSKYLGNDKKLWRNYDVSALIKDKGWKGPEILIDQGTNDQFLKEQLKPELLLSACEQANVPIQLRMQEGYDHSYYFISSFIEDHLRFHGVNL